MRYARLFSMCLLALVAALVTNGWYIPTSVYAADETFALAPSKDNTLYETATGSQSNGAGEYVFVGRTAQSSNSIRRGVIAFDVAGTIPPGSTISSATLTLSMSRTLGGVATIDLHRLLSNWGEGTSNAFGNEGAGAPATTNDATWIHTFFNTSTWAIAGGDFSPTVSASQAVGGIGTYAWSSAQVVSDVQSWLDNPSSNFGWLLQGNELSPATSKRFDSGENVSSPPVLTIKLVPSSVGGIAELPDVARSAVEVRSSGGVAGSLAVVVGIGGGTILSSVLAWFVRRAR